MEIKAFLENLAGVLDVEPGTITTEFKLRDGTWDSVAMLSAIALIDEHYGVTLSADQLRLCETPGDLIELIKKELPA